MIDTDWSLDGQSDLAASKCRDLLQQGCHFSEFGTRRRRSFETQESVVAAFAKVAQEVKGPGSLVGASNVYLAFKYGLTPIGTVAHEWTMAVSALEKDLKHANRNALLKWIEAYPSYFHVGLTDTFGTQAFFDDFDFKIASKYDGVRHDSGDPFLFTDKTIQHYQSLGIDPTSKKIIFSDSLTVKKCIEIREYCLAKGGPKPLFGVGTHFTNDFLRKSDSTPSKAMNIVIKLVECNGKHVIKLSDDPSKHQGNAHAVQEALAIFFPK